MISRAKTKLIASLDRKKIRDREGLFLVEGEKMVGELLEPGKDNKPGIVELIATGDWLSTNQHLLPEVNCPLTQADDHEIRKLSHLVNPQTVMAVVRIPGKEDDPALLAGETLLGFESVRDPGNLGTIIRTADWFGIRHIVCTPDSVDAFNPKVVQSTMGALFRVQVHYLDLKDLILHPAFASKPVYGTFLSGVNLYDSSFEESPLILFGNESKGLSVSMEQHLSAKITIPSFARGSGSESLNLASSVAIVCSEYRRR